MTSDANDETDISEELKAYVNEVIKKTELPISIDEIKTENLNDKLVSKTMDLL